MNKKSFSWICTFSRSTFWAGLRPMNRFHLFQPKAVMRHFKPIPVFLVLMAMVDGASFAATLVDFNGIGPRGQAAPSISALGVTISFTNLEVSEIGETSNGFYGNGENQVFPADRSHFNGQFLTALGVGMGSDRGSGFIRTIAFDSDVTNVSLYVADIDFWEGTTATAYDRNGSSLLSLSFPASLGLNGRVQLVDFGTLSGIREVTLVGNDPVGIDNLSFSPVERVDIDFLRGDSNADGKLDVADPIANLTFQFIGTFDPPCRDALDFDDSGLIDVSDPIANLTHQFLGGPPPSAPGKEICGVDPTDDELSCDSFAACPGDG